MSRVVDLLEDDELLHTTVRDGPFVFGGQLLADGPAAAHLGTESPRYLLWNKRAGLTIEHDDGSQTRHEPDDNYRALAVVTDARLVVIVGQAGGDVVETLSHTAVVEARVSRSRVRNLLTGRLVVETLSGDRWEFACRGELPPVAEYLDRVAQIWARANRLCEAATAELDRAAESLAAGDHEQAVPHREDAAARIETATEYIERLDDGAAPLRDRHAALRSRLAVIERRIQTARAADAHSRAQTAWADGRYEEAATAYDAAVAGYEEALSMDETLSDGERTRLSRRLEGARRERELLRVGPLIDAETAHRRALQATDPEEGASSARRALDLYRDALGLAAVELERPFRIDRETVRTQAVEAADTAIDLSLDAGKRWLAVAEELRENDRPEQARRVEDRAEDRIADARRVAEEVRPERRAELTADADHGAADGLLREPALPPSTPADRDRVTVRQIGTDGGTTMALPDETTTASGGLEQFGTPSEELSVLSLGDVPRNESGIEPAADGADGERIAERLAGLSETAFTDLLAQSFERQGWTATPLSTNRDHDIVLTRDGQARAVVTTNNDPEERVGTETIRAHARSARRLAGVDRAVYVTSGKVIDHEEIPAVTVIDRRQLATVLETTGLIAKLPEADPVDGD